MSIIGFTIAKHKLKIKEMSMENQRDYKAEAKALRFKKGLSDKALSKIAATKKYKENNKVFVARKSKIRQETINLKAELFDYIIEIGLIEPKDITDILNNGIEDIKELDKRMRLLKMQKAEERYKFKKK